VTPSAEHATGFQLELVVTLHDPTVCSCPFLLDMGLGLMIVCVIMVQVSNNAPLSTLLSISDLPMSSADIIQAVNNLKSVLDFLGNYSDVVKGLTDAIQTISEVCCCYHHSYLVLADSFGFKIHPIAKVVVTALLIPYKANIYWSRGNSSTHYQMTAIGE
jgi:hypothetical protein